MPNHVECDLYVTTRNGLDETQQKEAAEQLKRFKTHARGEKPEAGEQVWLDHHVFIPYPQRFVDQDKLHDEAMARAERGEITRAEAWRVKDGFNSGGYEWCRENWGTKWGIYQSKLIEEKSYEGESLAYTFQSAWSPPLPVILKMSADFPLLSFWLDAYERGAAYFVHAKFEQDIKKYYAEGEYYGPRGG